MQIQITEYFFGKSIAYFRTSRARIKYTKFTGEIGQGTVFVFEAKWRILIFLWPPVGRRSLWSSFFKARRRFFDADLLSLRLRDGSKEDDWPATMSSCVCTRRSGKAWGCRWGISYTYIRITPRYLRDLLFPDKFVSNDSHSNFFLTKFCSKLMVTHLSWWKIFWKELHYKDGVL